MRIVFLVAVIILFQLCTFGVAKGLIWLIRPYLSSTSWLLPLAFVMSNAILISLFFGQFRWVAGYLAVLWFGVLTCLAMVLLNIILTKFSLSISDVWTRLLAVAGFFGLIGLSLYNAYTPVVRQLTVQVDKPMPKPVRVAVASDLHLGQLFGATQLHALAKILHQERVDVLLMPGDIMDDNTKVYDAKNMQSAFRSVVQAVDGRAVASLGNHDLYQVDARQSIAKAVQETGAILLDDKVAVLDVDGVKLSLIGRFDDHANHRKTTAELFDELPKDARQYPVILLDHRPSQIDDNVKLPIDVQVSGHTHNGQVFPANFIVKAINRLGYGHEKIANTHVVVSSGYGFWGVPFRLGSQSEIWVIDVVPPMTKKRS